MKKRKGQYLVVEEILLFGMGLAILIGLIVTFTSLNTSISKPMKEQQLEEVSNYMVGKMVELVKLNVSFGYLTFNIPKQIMGETYTISGIDNQLIVYSASGVWINKTAPITMSGEASSTTKSIMLKYSENKIELRGVTHY